MLVSIRIGSKTLYRFSHILMVCALIPERFSEVFYAKVFLTLFIVLIFLLNKSTKKNKQMLKFGIIWEIGLVMRGFYWFYVLWF